MNNGWKLKSLPLVSWTKNIRVGRPYRECIWTNRMA